MPENSNHKYDLEERTFQFAKNVALYTKKLPKPDLCGEACELKKIFLAILNKCD